MLKEKTCFVGVGQCGNNLASEMEKKYEYYSLMINTSKEDMQAVNPKHSFHLEGGIGLAKEPEKVKELLEKNDNIEKLSETLKKHTETFEVVFVEFSCGGGTGSALGYMICNLLVRKFNKVVCPVVVIPNETDESVKVAKNTLDCLNTLSGLQGVGATFVLDNKKRENKFSINHEFADVLNDYLTRENVSNKGNMDESEFMKLLTVNGCAILTKVSKDKSNSSNIIATLKNNIYAEQADFDAQYLGLSIATGNNKIDKSDIIKEVGFVMDDFCGFGGNNTLLFLAGLSYPEKRIGDFEQKIRDNAENLKKLKEKTQSPKMTKKDTFDDLFDFSKEEPKEEQEEEVKEEKQYKTTWDLMREL